MEKVVEIKKCKHCNSRFEITDKDLEFYKKVSPVFEWKKYQIPTPTLCPDCRQQRRLVWRNERKLYKRTCDATGKPIISMYSPDKPYKVYGQEFWWSDKWDALDYGRDFDFSKWFFEQFKELVRKNPHNALINHYRINENSDYWNFTWNNKNCYLVFEAGSLEDCYYSENLRKSKNTLDSIWSIYCEESYYLIDCSSCFNCFHCQDTQNCRYSHYLLNCKNCENCYMSCDLENKKYCLFNKQYTKKDYFKELLDFKKKYSNMELLQKYNNLLKWRKVIFFHWFWNETCVWDYIYNSKWSKSCFNARNLEDCKYCCTMSSSKDKTTDCYDYDYFWATEQSYEIITVWEYANRVLFSVNTWDNVSNILYSCNCTWSKNCFWCFSLPYSEYCILNKQYTKEEYNRLVPKIIEHMQKTWEWWEFFQSSLSPFWYNETVAQEYFPLTKEEALSLGFNWSDYESPKPKVDKVIPTSKLPNDIKEIPDDILNWAIECEVTKKPFRIIKEELEFYRKHNLPIPRRHPDRRHLDRMKLRNPRKLYDRKCDKCGKDIKTTYSRDRKEIIYCEECYNKEVY